MVPVLRIYADASGESHFEDVELSFAEEDFVPPAPPVLITSFEPASSYAFEQVPPGWHGDWHPAPTRVLAIYLSGHGVIEASDGEVRPIEPGTIIFAEDTTGKGHTTGVYGDQPAVIATIPLA